MSSLRWIIGLLTLLGAAGWIVAGYQASKPCAVEPVVRREVVYIEVKPDPKPTPYADSLVDFEALERDTDCLWVILQAEFGYEITMERVTAAALWTHELGGACAVIGEDDEVRD